MADRNASTSTQGSSAQRLTPAELGAATDFCEARLFALRCAHANSATLGLRGDMMVENRLIRSPQRQNHCVELRMKKCVFPQPGSFAEVSRDHRHIRLDLASRQIADIA
jgi:hypothetical protein